MATQFVEVPHDTAQEHWFQVPWLFARSLALGDNESALTPESTVACAWGLLPD